MMGLKEKQIQESLDRMNSKKILKTPTTAKEVTWAVLEDPSFSRLSSAWSNSMMLVIFLSTSTFILESEFTQFEYEWGVCETIFVVIFSIEFVLRLGSCPDKRNFLRGKMNWIDLLAVLPFYLEASNLVNGGGGMRVVRVVRLVRVFRVFKFGKYSMAMKVFTESLQNSAQPLLVLLVLIFIGTIVFSSAIYYFEMESETDIMNEQFRSIPSSFWWCIVTMTTVGYGDAYPTTPLGKLVGVTNMLVGLLVLALPITVVGSNFAKLMDAQELCEQSLKETDADADGQIEERELQEFLTKKQEGGQLKREFVNITPAEIIRKFSTPPNKWLSPEEFAEMSDWISSDDDIGTLLVNTTSILREINSLNEARYQDSQLVLGLETRMGRCERLLESIAVKLDIPIDIPVLPTVKDVSSPLPTIKAVRFREAPQQPRLTPLL